LGVQIDGYPVVVAQTVQVPPTADSKESDPALAAKIANLMHGTNTAMEAALRKLVVGGKNNDVTEVLSKVAEQYKINVVQGVLSHNMSRYLIDGEKVILSKADAETRVDEVNFGLNEVWALDIVMSTGDGKPKQVSDRTTVFKRSNDVRYQLKLKASNYVISEVNKNHPYFPFSLRALDEKQGRLGMLECLNHGLVQDYPVLLENEGEYVAHIKATVLLLASGPARITSSPFDLTPFKTELKVEDPDLKALLATAYKKKKKSGKKNKKEGAADAEPEKDE
jgi:curved DNA binding protein